MYCQIAVINYDVYFVFVAAILFVLASRHGKYRLIGQKVCVKTLITLDIY